MNIRVWLRQLKPASWKHWFHTYKLILLYLVFVVLLGYGQFIAKDLTLSVVSFLLILVDVVVCCTQK